MVHRPHLSPGPELHAGDPAEPVLEAVLEPRLSAPPTAPLLLRAVHPVRGAGHPSPSPAGRLDPGINRSHCNSL